MNILTALLPHKHVKFSESLIALAGIIRDKLHEPRSVDEIMVILDKERALKKKPDFTQVIMALNILFTIHQIQSVSDGRVVAVQK
jgi:hypothetical protein